MVLLVGSKALNGRPTGKLKKHSYYDLLNDSICGTCGCFIIKKDIDDLSCIYLVFCKNADINYLDENFFYYTSKLCGHQVCKSCYNNPRVFSKREVECPECAQRIKRSILSEKPKDVLEYEREREIRLAVMREFNQTEEDFDEIQKYREYRELAEEIIYKKVMRQNLGWVEEKLQENRKKYRAKIARNASKQTQENKRLVEEIKAHKLADLKRMQQIEEAENKLRLEKELEREELIRVKLGELKATTAQLKRQAEEAKKRKQEGEGYGGNNVKTMVSASAQAAARMAALQPKPLDIKINLERYSPEELKAKQIRAAGYDKTIVNKRTKELMMSCLIGTS